MRHSEPHSPRGLGDGATHTHRRELPVLDSSTTSSLPRALASRVRGEVRFDSGSRALYATDASNYREVPMGLVVPRNVEDVLETIEVCREFGVPILPRGGGTSLAGQCTNVAVVVDFSKHLRRIDIDEASSTAWVEPGVVLDDLRTAARPHGLTFGPDPSTHNRCTLGGMIGNNSCGVHSMMAGTTADNVVALDVVTYDGTRFLVNGVDPDPTRGPNGGREAEIRAQTFALAEAHADEIRARFPRIPRCISGYNLTRLLPENGRNLAQALVGSEGTLVTVLGARVRLVPRPPERVLVILGYGDVFEAAEHIMKVREAGPIGLEGIDSTLVRDMHIEHLHTSDLELLPDGDGFLFAEFGGSSIEEARDKAEGLLASLGRSGKDRHSKLIQEPAQQKRLWKIRESGLGATARVPGQSPTWEGWEDSAVAPERLASYLRALRGLLDRFGYRAALYGHFGQGCVHTRIPFDLGHPSGVAAYRRFVEEAADIVVEHGGSLSGEHGDGQSRAELLPKMFGERLVRVFEKLKDIWDPAGKMNPGKIVHPRRLDRDLRLGPRYDRPELATHFQYPKDHGSFAFALERCVGVGECRRTDGGTMCPSYMVTREEAQSTRGRAHLLLEAMRGALTGWQSEPAREALDLCLSCKGCKRDCPVHVDVATYKAEFLAHYYEDHRRPRSAYLFGLIRTWSRLASLAPRLANFVARGPGLRTLARLAGDIHPDRLPPAFATQTFRKWWDRRPEKEARGRPVVLWPDTFNDHFEPRVLIAAVDVLEAAGFDVVLPPPSLCCGRPLYDFGMLDRAKERLRESMRVLAPVVAAGIPVVGVEPSCVAVFRDELLQFFPEDETAKTLAAQTLMLDELLAGLDDWRPPARPGKMILHGHCHQKAVMGIDGEVSVLERMSADLDVLDAGCCGMAGAFGYERDHYDVSVACAERRLLPAVRGAAAGTILVADGFSCRQQISQLSGRRALHLAEVLSLAAHPRGA